jgi:alanyl aminopeptidase
MSRISLSSFVLGLTLALEPVAAEGDLPPELRLGDAVQPKEYSIQLRLNPESETFSGTVVIPIHVAVPPPEVIWLNARDIKVENAVVVEEQRIATEIVDGGDDYVGLRLEESLRPGKAQILIDYTGLLRKDETSGLFRRQVADDWYLFTQMEPLDARRVFPGFDEPGFKVPFEVSIAVPEGNRAFFNTPVESETTAEDGWTTFRFARSKPLPTYLLAVGVGPFDVVDAGAAGKNDTKMRIIVPRGKSEHAKWAVEATGPILELLEDYFGSPYPYEKLDQLAVPNIDLAMEHPGLVTYAQQMILRHPSEDTIPRQREFALVCAHELAHMWFGDLVTMAWWDDLWLNESFASWMENKIVDRWQPGWDRDVSAVSRRSGALEVDSLASARQIRQPIHSNGDIVNAFDGITYSKGASVLQMFESWIGEEPFRKGVRAYINGNAHSNATAGDFLAALQRTAGNELAEAFATFLDQNGAPEITAKLSCPEQGRPLLALSQRRYVPQGSPRGAEQKWNVPVCVGYGRGDEVGRACTLMKESSATLELETDGCPDWVLPNADLNGYYRVNYSKEMLDSSGDGARWLDDPRRRAGPAAAIARDGEPARAGEDRRHCGRRQRHSARRAPRQLRGLHPRDVRRAGAIARLDPRARRGRGHQADAAWTGQAGGGRGRGSAADRRGAAAGRGLAEGPLRDRSAAGQSRAPRRCEQQRRGDVEAAARAGQGRQRRKATRPPVRRDELVPR